MEECFGLSRTRAGFTLLELVIAMVVVVILATIAYPSYQDNLRKGRRAAAQSFLIETASLQQQYLLDARSYAVVLLREIERTNESRDAGVAR